MRLHRLTLTAIGPFAGRVEIDFSRLGAAGLFLLEGPTGSGKSTIIDAISFALYGKVAQSTADSERLRSHHAAAGVEPVVELVFETQSGVYQVRRTPSFDRPKKSGVGTTRANATVKIWRLETGHHAYPGEPLSTRIAEADDEISRAVGLTHDQFVQTVVLPQGEFASFLRSDTDTKKALLQKLFGTEVTARLQAQLVEGRRQAEQRRASSAIELAQAARTFGSVAGVDEGAADELLRTVEAGDIEALRERLSDTLAQLLAGQAALAARRDEATAERRTRETALATARDVHRRRDRRDELRTQQSALELRRSEVEAARAELSAAERALNAVSSAEALVSAIARSEEAQDVDQRARAELRNELRAADETTLRAAAADVRITLGELADEVTREQQLERGRRALDEATQQADGLGAAAQTARRELGELPSRLRELTIQRDTAAIAAGRLDSLIAERDRASRRLAASLRAVAAAEHATRDEQITLEALSALQQQQQRLAVLRTTRVASIAGELGLSLTAGDPCAVCGSVDHPKPARRRKDHVSQDQVDAAESELSRLQKSVDGCRVQLEQQRLDLAELQVAADQLNPDLAEAKLDEVTAALDAAQRSADELSALDQRLATTHTLADELAERAHAAEVGRAALAQRIAALQDTIGRDEVLVERARDGHQSVADRVVTTTATADRLDHAAQAAARAASALATAIECGSRFADALHSAGFDDETTWRAAHRSSSDIAELQSGIRRFDDLQAAVAAQLAHEELADPALNGELPELAELGVALEAAAEAERNWAEQYGSARDRLVSTEKHALLLTDSAAGCAQLLLDTAPAIRLGNLVAGLGENQLRMDLATYVLLRRFADVVSAANTQLRKISSGRYELEHSGARAGNARSGLGLSVLDLHTGRPRDPGTLSGGETFYVSLSLALGLAEVVRAESGGVDLGTLFVDEGFGTLDPETLDEVLAVLDSLRDGGRCVGVVSHVAELKARVPDRIEVRRDPDGSSRIRTIG